MLSVVVGALFVLAPAQQTDAAGELQAAVAKLAAAQSVQFEVRSESSRSSQDADSAGDRRAGAGGGAGYTTAQVLWKKGLPMRLTVGDQVAYKLGDKLVHKDDAGKWAVLEMPERGRGGRRGPAGGGEGGEAGGGARGSSGFGGGGGARALQGLESLEAPSKLLADFASKVADVSREARGDLVVFSGKLTEKGAEELAGRGPFGGRGNRGEPEGEGAERPQVETSGTYEISLRNGLPSTLTFEVKRAGSFGERSFEMTAKRTLTIAKVDGAELDVPAEVLALFE